MFFAHKQRLRFTTHEICKPCSNELMINALRSTALARFLFATGARKFGRLATKTAASEHANLEHAPLAARKHTPVPPPADCRPKLATPELACRHGISICKDRLRPQNH